MDTIEVAVAAWNYAADRTWDLGMIATRTPVGSPEWEMYFAQLALREALRARVEDLRAQGA